jgi:hypothetical protein
MMITRSSLLPMPLLVAAIVLTALGFGHAQSGSFIIPTLRANGGSDFAYWDLFRRPPGSSSSANFNHPNPPALIDGFGEDLDGNPTTAFAPRAVLTQTGTPTAFVTSSGAIYSFSNPTTFEASYSASAARNGEVTNVVFQTMTGGARLNVNTVVLRYENSAGATVDLPPLFRALDDPQTGAFSERIICAFQWNLTGLGVRSFRIVFGGLTTMPLWHAQLDAVIGESFVQELGYLLATRSRPVTRFGRAGLVNTNLPITADGRFFLAGEMLNLTGEPTSGWEATGWFYNGAATAGASLPLVFPAQDITVTALFAPTSYLVWREAMFNRANTLLGTADDYLNEAVSGQTVDHDGDGLTNAGEYAFAGDPYLRDAERTRPEMLIVEASGVSYPAIRYRSNGLNVGAGDVLQWAQLSANGGWWQQNASGQPAVTVVVSRELQADGSMLVMERTVQPLSAFNTVAMQVAWSVGGAAGTPLEPAALTVVTELQLAAGRQGSSYEVRLAAAGGAAPYEWSLSGGALPAGLTLEADGRLSGLPQVSGSFGFTVRMEDPLGSEVTRAFTLEIAAYEIATATQLGSVSVQTLFERQLAVTGGTGPFVWSLSGGALPDGLSLSTEGRLSGVPTAAGAAAFTVQVVDANLLTTTRAFELMVVDLQIATPAVLPLAVLNRDYQLALEAIGGRGPLVWSLEGGALPVGVELQAGVLTGKPLQVVNASFVLRVEDADGNAVTRAFEWAVSARLPLPVLAPMTFPDLTIGAEVSFSVRALNYPERYVISGLPSGLRWQSRTGAITGRAAVAGVFRVTAQAFNATGGSAPQTATLLVRALPGAMVGRFTGWSDRHAVNGGLGSLLSLSTTSTGAFTLSVRTGSVSRSARGFLRSMAPQVQVEVAGGMLSLSLDAQTGAVSGTHGSAVISGWRAVWDPNFNPASGREGYYSVAMDLDASHASDAGVPKGVGFATFTVPANGLLRVVGKTADGQNLVSSGPMGPNGEIAIYAAQHGNQGSVLGKWALAEDEDGVFSENEVSGELTWQKPGTSGRLYAGAFGPLRLNVIGRYLAPGSRGHTVVGLPEFGPFDLEFSEGGIGQSATVANVSGIEWTDRFAAVMPTAGNAGQVSVRINRSTGAMSGVMTLVETAPPLVRRHVSFVGQVVRTADAETRAVGYFLLPQIPLVGQKPNATPILSGAVYAVQPTR